MYFGRTVRIVKQMCYRNLIKEIKKPLYALGLVHKSDYLQFYYAWICLDGVILSSKTLTCKTL